TPASPRRDRGSGGTASSRTRGSRIPSARARRATRSSGMARDTARTGCGSVPRRTPASTATCVPPASQKLPETIRDELEHAVAERTEAERCGIDLEAAREIALEGRLHGSAKALVEHRHVDLEVPEKG